MVLKAIKLLVILAAVAVSNGAQAADWVKYSTGIHTKSTVPVDYTIRIRVVSTGAHDQPKLGRYWGTSNVIAEDKRHLGNVTKGQIIEYKMPESFKVSISIGGLNYYTKPLSAEPMGEFTRLTFRHGWVLDVKIVPPPF